MIFLGLDPSISAFGYCVLATNFRPEYALLDIGTWTTKVDKRIGKMADRALRVERIGAQLLELIRKWKPTHAAVESLALGMKTSRSTAQTLGRMRGLVEGILLAKGIELGEVRPDVLKLHVCGDRSASKEQVAEKMVKLYAVPDFANVDENATDALAVAHLGSAKLAEAMKQDERLTLDEVESF